MEDRKEATLKQEVLTSSQIISQSQSATDGEADAPSGTSKNLYIIMQNAAPAEGERVQEENTHNNNVHIEDKSSEQMPPPTQAALDGAIPDTEITGAVVDMEADGISACLICGDKASGYHYSVYSCEGCKGFFKRSVQKALQYGCKDQGMCFINKFSRNSCQYCRFEKCLIMGMKRDAVREDRSPGGKHRHKRPRTDDCDESGMGGLGFESGASDNTKGGECGGEPDRCGDDTLREHLVAAKPFLYPKAENATEKGENISLNEMMHYGYLELRYVIEWAKKVPGFSELAVADQMSLLKSSFMELNVLRLSYRSMGLDNKIKFAEEIILSLEFCESMGWGKELVSGTIDFAQRLKEIAIDQTEFCILNAIVLMYPDAHGISNKICIAEMQSKILDCLRRHVFQTYPHDTKRFGKILLRLPALRVISAHAAERFLSLTFEGSIHLNELVLEMIN